VAASPAAVTASPAQQRAIDVALSSPELRGAHVGLLAVDASGTTVYALDPDDDFVPASTFKLIVGSAALSKLGSAFTFGTGVDAIGPVNAGTLNGDLVLRGGGDAQLAVADLQNAATAVRAAGIVHITGDIVADASYFSAPRYPGGWMIDDLPYEYAAVPSALSLDRNIAHVRVRPGSAAGAQAQLSIAPAVNAFTVVNRAVTGARGSDDTTDLDRPWNLPTEIDVIGSYPLGAPLSDDLEPAVPDPPAYVAAVFHDALVARGVSIDGAVRFTSEPGGAHLWQHRSEPLRAMLGDFWRPSVNLIGEQLLEALGVASSPAAHGDDRAAGILVETAWLRSIGIDPRTVTIADGSGLSAYDRITPRALVTILASGWHGRYRTTLLAALPVSGRSGTLVNDFTSPPLAGAIVAKTGTTNHARLLAGYARRPDGSATIFALMIENWMDDRPDADARLNRVRETILRALTGG
jgi:D-alanyl-D-alanine carboxypeptidase/D-alanyl-D-alanine-endopeptidase (penicillin-binding protein 4)